MDVAHFKTAVEGFYRLTRLTLRSISENIWDCLGTHFSLFRGESMIEYLDIGGNSFTDEDIFLVLDSLPVRLTNFIISDCSAITDVAILAIAPSSAANLVEFNISCCPNLTVVSLKFITRTAVNLKNLDISGCSNVSVEWLLNQKCVALESLNMSNLLVDDHGLDYLGTICNFNSLRFLSFSGNIQFSPSVVVELIKFLSVLEELDLSRCVHFEVNDFIDLATGLSGELQRIDVSECPSVSNEFLQILCSSCRNLSTVILRSCTRLTNDGVTYIGECLDKLTFFDISHCSNVGEVGLIEVIRGCSNLEFVDFSYCECSMGVFQYLGLYSTRLRYFRTSGPSAFICDSAMMVLANGCVNLRSLNIETAAGTSNANFCLSDSGLNELGRCLAHLSEFDCSGATAISNTGMRQFLAGCQNIRRLNLSECVLLSDSTCRLIATSCSQVEFLSLAGVNVTDKGVEHLSLGCVVLRSLDLSRTKITDLSLDKIADSLHICCELFLAGCIKLTSDGLLNLLKKRQTLRELDISDVPNVVEKVFTIAIALHIKVTPSNESIIMEKKDEQQTINERPSIFAAWKRKFFGSDPK